MITYDGIGINPAQTTRNTFFLSKVQTNLSPETVLGVVNVCYLELVIIFRILFLAFL
ncbi:Ubiquitin-fold modifier 1 [Manis javanica]|nr:Ubiquitin-fold modifier 1 [Manis javanica]